MLEQLRPIEARSTARPLDAKRAMTEQMSSKPGKR
jgi:hypothetical protein